MKVLLDAQRAAPILRHMAPMPRRKVKAAIRLLAEDPSGLSARLDVRRLDTEAGTPVYRLRIGDWRVVFTVEREVVVLRIFHRSEGYGWLADMPM